MSEFADQFSEKISKNSSSISQDLESGIEERVQELLSEDFRNIFYSEEIEQKKEDFNVIASDAGRNDIEFRNNTRLYIVRASAVDESGEKSRKIDTDTLRPYRQADYEQFLQRASEIVELDSILEKLDETKSDEKKYVLIDGTLLTRLLVTPEELRLSKQQDKCLELIEKFQELLERAEEDENLVLAGVSKDSNSGILYSQLVSQLLERKIESLEEEVSGKEEIDTDTLEFLDRNYDKIRYAPEEIRTALQNLRDENIDVSEVEELLDRYRMRISDTEFVSAMASGTGFTKPLEVGEIKKDFFSAMDDFDDNSQKFIERNFRKSLQESGDESKYRKKVTELLENLRDSPGVVSFYWIPAENDMPLRIDLLSHDMNGSRLKDFEDPEFVEPGEKVRDILELLKTGYAGEGMHNVWISQADNSASLTNSRIEKVYKPLLSKQLGENLRKYMRRRDKRV